MLEEDGPMCSNDWQVQGGSCSKKREREGGSQRCRGPRSNRSFQPLRALPSQSILPPASPLAQTLTLTRTRRRGTAHTKQSPRPAGPSQGRTHLPTPADADNWGPSTLPTGGPRGSRQPAERGERTRNTPPLSRSHFIRQQASGDK